MCKGTKVMTMEKGQSTSQSTWKATTISHRAVNRGLLIRPTSTLTMLTSTRFKAHLTVKDRVICHFDLRTLSTILILTLEKSYIRTAGNLPADWDIKQCTQARI